MKQAMKITTLLTVLVLFSGTAIGGTYDPGINKRQKKQQKRIIQGLKSGELTAREAVRIEKEQARIAKKERRFKSDGMMTKRERKILHKDLNISSKHIYNQKHDRQRRR